jgi:hypothetical protein
MTFLYALAALLALFFLLACGVFVAAARAAAKRAAVDTFRFDAMREHRLSLFARDGTTQWCVMHNGKLIASHDDPRVAVDLAVAVFDSGFAATAACWAAVDRALSASNTQENRHG